MTSSIVTSCALCLQRCAILQRTARGLTSLVSTSAAFPAHRSLVRRSTEQTVEHEFGARSSNLIHTSAEDHQIKGVWHNAHNVPASEFSSSVAALQEIPDYDLIERVEEQVQEQDVGRLFAVVHIQGMQRKVTAEDIIVLRTHLEPDIGERIRLNKVLMVGSKDFTLIGRPILHADTVRVEATILEKTLSSNRSYYWYLRRRNVSRFRLITAKETMLRINSIELLQVQGKA